VLGRMGDSLTQIKYSSKKVWQMDLIEL